MSDLPYMPLYVADYIGDTAHLTTLEHGAYVMLIFTYWMRQKPLPDDAVKLSRIAKVSAADWESMAGTLAEFFQVGDGVWAHKRVDAELVRAKDKLEKASSAGRASAEAKRNRCSTPDEQPSNGRSASVERQSNYKVRLGKDISLGTSPSERDARAPTNFEKFWEVWPHKVNRMAAESALAKLEGELDEILAGVARYIASRAPDQQWPDPAKWLEGRRWEDEYAPRAVRGSSEVATLDMKRHVAGKVYILQHTPQGEAWEKHAKKTGRSQLWDRDGGWLFASEWPPPDPPMRDRGELVQIGRAINP